ncbi:SNF1-related protein kinase regulatory subunit beta-3 [Raphanus sativus]|uniref:SNF1-related protein kinase regulatory subunit beta-3 n=1 Tax=Raphanus sativus TaxID=3726 RepID=A0A9W3BXU2_RAPSA|nr:SNF1-related protein kinase regulatory subunit beta-3 [Raphanus sativus]XP_056844108.1 SNF1-related protein kinase regulatory subunit beta-3 [Raphanus sativus]KAJ4891159.1 SNF1-related protein kinase regulatory subunit beta-3 [Raphanus sativus]
MNNSHPGDDHEDTTVAGFEVPVSPVSSYNNVYSATEDETRDPPAVPPHLQHSLLGHTGSTELPCAPQSVVLNHLYIENRDPPRSVVALGFSHRFRSKYVTVVIYKPVQRRGNANV